MKIVLRVCFGTAASLFLGMAAAGSEPSLLEIQKILGGKKITTHHLAEGVMHSLGTPEDVDLFLKEFGARHKVS